MKVHFHAMGASLFRRSYRLEEESFWKLLDIIANQMPATGVLRKKNRGAVPNGANTKEARLSMALRYFAGGDPLDICIKSPKLASIIVSVPLTACGLFFLNPSATSICSVWTSGKLIVSCLVLFTASTTIHTLLSTSHVPTR